ncbi:hypothetical protein M271_11830 [Streptomyces rapamycinicus NRRL 5491]|uniref:Uncharacterized protein n=1 Tax=Streptomyces rapamycinicus TaxID=1226757 RepID=A0ABR6LGI3_9ACTN|nr:hypothetical protein M271_11830 [Streptomyces rapamycinicus NRRL 5491]MBB4781454.1 hypothetical protein [Streptomyces rapamycinicus]
MLNVAPSTPICRITRRETSCSRRITGSGSAEGYWWRRKDELSG